MTALSDPSATEVVLQSPAQNPMAANQQGYFFNLFMNLT